MYVYASVHDISHWLADTSIDLCITDASTIMRLIFVIERSIIISFQCFDTVDNKSILPVKN